MFHPLWADGLATGAGERLAAFVIKCLAVGGGFLVGYFLGKAAAWALDRWVLAHKSPPQLKSAVALAGGVALALVVALVVFGEGGGGLFGSRGGQGEDKGNPTPDEKGKAEPIAQPVPKKDEPEPKKDDRPKTPGPRKTLDDQDVTILTGGAKTLYLVEGDPTPKTLEQLKAAVAAKRAASQSEPMLIFRFRGDPLSETHPEMVALESWLKEAKLNNRFE